MKKITSKIVFTTIIIFINITNIYATPRQISVYATDFDEDISLTRPHRLVEIGENYVRVTYDFNDALIAQLDSGFHDLKVHGFIPESFYNIKSAYAARMEKTDLIQIPDGYSASLSIKDAPFKEYSHDKFLDRSKNLITIYPEDGKITSDNNTLNPNKISYNNTTPPVNICSQLNYRGINILELVITPIPYPSKNPMKVYSKIAYEVTFIKDNSNISNDKIKPLSHSKDQILVNNFVLNKYSESISDSSALTSKHISEDLLIVTHPIHKKAAEEYASWKESIGLNAHVMVRNDWTLSMLKDSIAEFYFYAQNPRYVLFLGDKNQIPTYSQYRKPDSKWVPDSIINDNYVCCINSRKLSQLTNKSTQIPDLTPGRLPFSNPIKIAKILSMIKEYELNPPTDPKFYNEVSLAALFEADYSNISPLSQASELWNFVQVSENEAIFLEKNYKNINRIYHRYAEGNPEKSDLVRPTYYSIRYPDCLGRTPFSIPSFLRKPNFNWNNDKPSFLNGMNHFLMIYNGHGHINQLGRPGHFLYLAPCSFSNGKNRPFVLSLGCLTGAYQYGDSTTVCQSMLESDAGGAIAVYAPTHSIYVFSANYIGAAILEGIFPNKNIEFPFGGYDINSFAYSQHIQNEHLGDIVNYGLMNLKSSADSHIYDETFLMCNLFGDPSMTYHISTPTPYDKAEVYRYRSKIKVVSGEFGLISIFNPQTNEQHTFVGSEIVQPVTGNSAEYRIAISNQNKIPFIVEPYAKDVVTFQNITLRSSSFSPIRVRKIYIGSNVDSEKVSGDVVIDGAFNIAADAVIIEPNTTFTANSNINIEF